MPPTPEARLLYLDPRRLVPDADNVRREPGDLQSLAASLQQYGVLQPLGVVPLDGGAGATPDGRYRVVYGNRRRAAAILAGLPAVPCLHVPLAPGGSPDPLVAQLLENMQRRELNDMEKAEGLARLRRHLASEQGGRGAGPGEGGEGLDERVAALVGLAPRTVRRYLALRGLPPAVRDLLAEERLTVTQAQHLHQLDTPAQQTAVATRAAAEDWTAAEVSRVCAALARSPGLSLDNAVGAAGGGWTEVERLGPAPRDEGPAPAPPRPAPRPRPQAEGEAGAGEDGDLWLEDATGAPTPEARGEPDPFAVPGAGSGHAGGAASLEPQTRDGHRVFRIRTLSAFCDEVDRLARCLQDGDLASALGDDPAGATRLRLAAKSLAFTLRGVEGLLG